MASNKKLLVICPHPEQLAPGQRLKYEQYFDYFRANGYTVTVSPFMTLPFWNIVYKKGHYPAKVFWTLYGYLHRVFDLFRLPFYDGVYIFLWVVPFGPPIFEFLFALKKKMIYDIDDMVFLAGRQKHNTNHFMAIFKSRSRVIYLMKKAKRVITCTPTLDAFVRQYNPNTTDISSTINTDIYQPSNPYSNAKPLILGWSGSHSTAQYLYLLKDVLLDIRREFPFRLVVIGAHDFAIEGLDITVLPWKRETEVRDLQSIDIGLYPLPNEEWVMGKSGLKALQYMALGIPTVASAIGANFRVIEDGVSGFLVRTEEEWKARIRELAADPELRRQMGEKARQRVEQLYSVRANRDTYLNILDGVLQPSEGSHTAHNLNPDVVTGFGDEWTRFDQSALSEEDRQAVFQSYFAIFPWDSLPQDAVGFDLGCGSGRWAQIVASRVGLLHCIDASAEALEVAKRNLGGSAKSQFHHASVDAIPLQDASCDFGYSLGVLHHVPDTAAALTSCVAKLKPGAPFLVYLYYAFDNRPAWFRLLWKFTESGRFILSRSPYPLRYAASQVIAALVYWPLARLARLVERLGLKADALPLSIYRRRSFYVMRTDALDRFGTRLEQRFTQAQIQAMMEGAGLRDITFSEKPPYWCAVGRRR